jgi:hypothetical protein
LSEFVRVVELLLMIWHRWGLPLVLSVEAVNCIRQFCGLISVVDIYYVSFSEDGKYLPSSSELALSEL